MAIRVDSFQWSHVDFNLKHPIVSDRNVRRGAGLRDEP